MPPRKNIGKPFKIENPVKTGPEQQYGIVTKILGGSWMSVQCEDGKVRRCHIRGALQRFKTSNNNKILVKDHVLISNRDDKSGDILFKYQPDVARAMEKRGEMKVRLKEDDATEIDCGIQFEEEDQPFDFNTI